MGQWAGLRGTEGERPTQVGGRGRQRGRAGRGSCAAPATPPAGEDPPNHRASSKSEPLPQTVRLILAGFWPDGKEVGAGTRRCPVTGRPQMGTLPVVSEAFCSARLPLVLLGPTPLQPPQGGSPASHRFRPGPNSLGEGGHTRSPQVPRGAVLPGSRLMHTGSLLRMPFEPTATGSGRQKPSGSLFCSHGGFWGPGLQLLLRVGLPHDTGGSSRTRATVVYCFDLQHTRSTCTCVCLLGPPEQGDRL